MVVVLVVLIVVIVVVHGMGDNNCGRSGVTSAVSDDNLGGYSDALWL